MMFTTIKTMVAGIALLTMTQSAYAKTQTYFMPVECHESYVKYGANAKDLTKQSGQPIVCDRAIVSLFDDGGIFVQVFELHGASTPLGFVGYARLPKAGRMVTLPLQKILLPHAQKGSEEVLSGVQGSCFFGKDVKEKSLSDFSCAAMIDLGGSRLVYHIDVRVMGKAELVE